MQLKIGGLGFNDGNAVKYIARHAHKGNPIQDIKKAIWYLQRHLKNLEKEKEEVPNLCDS